MSRSTLPNTVLQAAGHEPENISLNMAYRAPLSQPGSMQIAAVIIYNASGLTIDYSCPDCGSVVLHTSLHLFIRPFRPTEAVVGNLCNRPVWAARFFSKISSFVGSPLRHLHPYSPTTLPLSFHQNSSNQLALNLVEPFSQRRGDKTI